MMRRRVLVTGAGGFVGHALASGFAHCGWDVIGLDRTFDSGPEQDGIRHVTADLAHEVPADVPGVDLVVHAAWVTTDAATLGVAPADYVALNLGPLRTVLDHAARTGPASFVFLSSSGVFAPDDATGGLTDADQPTAASPYAEAKRAGERWVPAALGPDTAVHVVRLGYLFGPGEGTRPSRRGVSLVAGWIRAARDGQPLVVRSDDPMRDWTFTSDLAPALDKVVAGPSAGHAVHLGSHHVWRDSAFAALIASRFPGAGIVRVPASQRVKPPMIPSDITALHGFQWTDPTDGVRAILAREVAA